VTNGVFGCWVGGHPHWSQKYGELSWIANTDWSNLKFAL
jgi:hypothetical protein